MRLGLVGLPMSGKTTIFNALTGLERPTSISAPGKLDVQIAAVDIPDPRLDQLTEMYQPQKKVAAQVTYVDIGGISKGISEGGLGGAFRAELAQMDAYVQVIRVFENDSVPHPEETIDPARDIEILDTEFLLSDLILVEKRIERITDEMSKGKNRVVNAVELALFERLDEALESEIQLRDLDLTDDEAGKLKGYGFLTLKPRLVLLNLGDERVEPETILTLDGEKTTLLAIQGELEMELSQLESDEDTVMFMEEYGITELTRDRLIRESFGLLNTQIFFTVGDDEVRAWPHRIGSTAQEAAGKIHTDLQRGFIRAEIIPWDKLLEAGTMGEARKAATLRLEGKNYLMQDGDVMTVRFNVK